MVASSQILTVAQMRGAEQALIDGGETVSSLMERAGKGAADYVFRMAAGRSVTVLCGPGNNGGDGYVIARVLAERGLAVQVVAPLAPKTEAAIAARKAWGGEPVSDAHGAIFVDCLFGSGLARPLDSGLEALLSKLARAHHQKVAVDLPSGVDSDSGELLNDDLPAYDVTISLGAWKFAHWSMPAMAMMGDRKLVDIGVREVRGAARVSQPPRLRPPPVDAHKYSRGLLAVVGGAMPGAALLSAGAAMHGGAGYVKLFAQDMNVAGPADLVVEFGSLFDLVRDHRISAMLVGPGLGRDDEARSRLDWTLACDLPTVVDADGLMLLEPEMIESRESPLIVTPHAGELNHLCNAFGTVGLDSVEQVSELAEAIEGIVVAKGPDTMIASEGGQVLMMPPAPSWLSTAGTGDVLAGLIASRLATGSRAIRAAEEGCWLHGEAARLSGPAFTAGTLIDAIPESYYNFL
jgi:hydroxyethylthiazole kinase-like uncharacterized protein yjeF